MRTPNIVRVAPVVVALLRDKCTYDLVREVIPDGWRVSSAVSVYYFRIVRRDGERAVDVRVCQEDIEAVRRPWLDESPDAVAFGIAETVGRAILSSNAVDDVRAAYSSRKGKQ